MIEFILSEEMENKIKKAKEMIDDKLKELQSKHKKSDHLLQVCQIIDYVDINKFEAGLDNYTNTLARIYKYLNKTKFVDVPDLCIYVDILEPYYKFSEYYMFEGLNQLKKRLTKQ